MRFIVKATPEELGEHLGKEIVDLVRRKPDAILGLATGSSPIPTYKAIAKEAKNQHVSFKNVTSFNLDEYIGLKDRKDSYRYFMEENLFKHIDIDPNATHFPNEKECDLYDKQIDEAGGIDFQVLGIGRNGHIGFNEPGTPFDAKTHIINLTQSTREANARFFASLDDVPTQAVSMGPATIVKARKIALLATDMSKVDAIRFLLSGKVDTSCPASILNNHPDTEILVTEEVYKAAGGK
jgi:glucosamine-6-phosphate deaminase